MTVLPRLGADDWPQWLGPHRDGVWREKDIVDVFPPQGPPLRWKTRIGSGYAGPAVADGRVYVCDRLASPVDLEDRPVLNQDENPINANFQRRALPGRERVVCLDESDGTIQWVHEYDCTYTIAGLYATGPRTTPVVEKGRVYTLGAEGDLFCLRARNGKVIWKRDLKRDFGVDAPLWGFSSHLLIDGPRLICMVGGASTTTVALNKKNGRELWWALSASEPGYAPPVKAVVGGREQLIIWHAEALNGLDPETGRVYWSIPMEPQFGMAIAMPRVSGDQIFTMSFNQQSHLVRIDPDGTGASIAWKGNTRRGIGGVLNTPFIQDGHVYGCGPKGRYTCIRLDTGDRRWTTYQPSTGDRPASWANVFTIRHRDRFFLANDQGDLIIANLSPGGYEEISRAHLIEPTHHVQGRRLVWSHPAFANQSIYLRNDEEIRCYSLAAP